MRNIEDYTDKYLEDGFEKYQVEFRRKKILEIMKRLQPKNILEIGCGMEPIFMYLAADSYDKIITVEASEVFFENANKLSADNSKVACVNAFFEEWADGMEESFDFILCSGLLHELEDPDKMLEAIKLLCQNARGKETIVHINVPNANSIHRLLAQKMGMIEDVHELSDRNRLFQQYSVFDTRSLAEKVEKHGFKIVERGSYFLKFFPHSMMMEMIENNIITYPILEGCYELSKIFQENGSEIYVNMQYTGGGVFNQRIWRIFALRAAG